ncbi:hypothetical protein CWO07_24040 [Vibrio splendidus]|uniref:Resolvase HTH domain-containing protein n=1 Tax=Vibrio splendidus TaxID=29497 RepID=A0A2T5EJZ6_VIBSP|nr:hypothetical protein [Vibrio splendidus]PTP20664.1 hypothetical protein CWO07_24040 [Vibrio splendidus]
MKRLTKVETRGRNPMFNAEQIELIYSYIDEGNLLKDIAEEMGCTYKTISRIKKLRIENKEVINDTQY